jgi:hypothetical protein
LWSLLIVFSGSGKVSQLRPSRKKDIPTEAEHSQPMTFGDPVYVWWLSIGVIPFGLGTDWGVNLQGGDSSDPGRVLVGNRLVLVTHNYTLRYGPDYAKQFDAINQQMHYLSTNNAVGTDYQLTPFLLTNWPSIH